MTYIATSLSGIYEISRKLYTTILFIKIDFTPAGHHQLDLKTISVYFKIKITDYYINQIEKNIKWTPITAKLKKI